MKRQAGGQPQQPVDPQEIAEVVGKFRDMRARGEVQSVAEFLTQEFVPQAYAQNSAVLSELVCIDLEVSWSHFRVKTEGSEPSKAVDRDLRLEKYLTAFPVLRDDETALLRLIETELQCQNRPQDAGDEYATFVPTNAEEISKRLQSLQAEGHLADSHPAADEEYSTVAPSSSTETWTWLKADSSVKSGEAIGKQVGDYRIEEEIARGGMGVVYRATQLRLNRPVALKMILAGQFASQEEIRRFYAEAEAAAGLDHPTIVPIFEVGEFEGQHYFSMAYIQGTSLADRVRQGPLPAREAAELVQDVAVAIRYAHENGVVHRDIKPSNILITDEGQPKVTDFGLAKSINHQSGLTASGQVLGTPSYMPPEQADGRMEDVGPHSDLYSLGAVLYCLLTGTTAVSICKRR